MVGKVYLSVVEYYDSKTKTTRKKGRPVLVVAGPRNNDYTVLPISTIKRREHLDSDYDIPIETNIRAGLALSEECFIRTHKQTTVHMGALIKQKGDMKNDYPDLYLTALQKMEEFQRHIYGRCALRFHPPACGRGIFLYWAGFSSIRLRAGGTACGERLISREAGAFWTQTLPT